MEHRKHLAKLNLVPAGTATGKTSLRVRIFSGLEWKDNSRLRSAYFGCDLARLYRVELSGRWFWPAPGDNRFAFLTADEMWGLLAWRMGDDIGVPGTPPAPPALPEDSRVSFRAYDGRRTRAVPLGAPFLDNHVWWVRFAGEALPVPCNALAS